MNQPNAYGINQDDDFEDTEDIEVPRKFRPPSLSIITLISEHVKWPKFLPTQSYYLKEDSNQSNLHHSKKFSITDFELHKEALENSDSSEQFRNKTNVVDDAENEQDNYYKEKTLAVSTSKLSSKSNQKDGLQEILIQPNNLMSNKNNLNQIEHWIQEKTCDDYNQEQQMFRCNQNNKFDQTTYKSILKSPSIGAEVASIGECSMGASGEMIQDNQTHNLNMNHMMNSRMVKLLSTMYGLLVVIIGAMITIGGMSNINNADHLYNIVITLIGLFFLVFIHVDVQRHKRYVLRWEQSCKESIESPMICNGGNLKECDSVSLTTAIIFNRVFNDKYNDTDLDDDTKKSLNAYRFLNGKHSGGGFYLKIGMILFCGGSIIHQGINVFFQIYYFLAGIKECSNVISLIVYPLHCISAFYQLYIAFKYSNLVINRRHTLVRFGLMHLVGSSLSFWFSTIMEEAIHGYMEKIKTMDNKTINHVFLKDTYEHHTLCHKNLTDFESIETMPYLYPFSIEFNIILASVWYIIWTNVENNNPYSEFRNVREELNEDRHTGNIEIVYRSNISIQADCHASNLGMFSGLFIMLLIIITIIVFFTTIKHDHYKTIGIAIYTFQLIFLTLWGLVAVSFGFFKIKKLNVSKHIDSAQTSMDDFLLFIPLPFYYIHHILCIYSEMINLSLNSIILTICYAMNLIQVTWQTPFIIDGIRRCSNENNLRYSKPGKQWITFSIIINVILWILLTFEIKSVDKYHSMPEKFGKFVWMIILDTCLPLMLFYRFHSSVCLSDMWKHCYEKDEH